MKINNKSKMAVYFVSYKEAGSVASSAMVGFCRRSMMQNRLSY
ncbi:hypothetical protein [Clostridium sporogenes]|nr:hypothetical protein [Clostridium sporogenes]